MKYRKLRITWSVFWGVAAVLLVVLWMRSYQWGDTIGVTPRCSLGTIKGTVYLAVAPTSGGQAAPGHKTYSLDNRAMYDMSNAKSRTWNLLFAFGGKPGWLQYYVVVRLYAVLAVISALALAPWIRHFSWHFSLRALLIATTLVAVVLGLIMWAR